MVNIQSLQVDAGDAVNGRWVDVPGYPGVRVRIAFYTLRAWAQWIRETALEGSESAKDVDPEMVFADEDDRERAFFGARIVREVEGIEDNGEPIVWDQSTGIRLMTMADSVKDERTGEPVKVYALDALYFWLQNYAQNVGNYVARVAGN